MKLYGIHELFTILKEYKITTNIESVRRWLREGTIEGIPPKSRKQGWQVSQDALDRFLADRLPNNFTTNVVKEPNNTTNDVIKEDNATNVVPTREQIREEMWYEITSKNIWEGFVEIKKTMLKEAKKHAKYSDELMKEVWQRCVENSKMYSKPRVSYLLEAFSFEGERILLDQNYADLEEQVIFAIVEYVKKTRKTRLLKEWTRS
ncbi:hypothetical protein ACFRCQ_27400 [Cytobacillus firmus]|uniref:hypothetical protein n=1 Tax=Cytobacillus firmus TaxID=1399 RepID=UPI0036A9FEE3